MSATLIIERILYTEYATLGRFLVEYSEEGLRKRDDLGEIFSIERAWHDNAVGKSCIPVGDYPLKKETQGRNFPKFQKRWGHEFIIELMNVPGRSQIQVHPCSHTQQLLGCIAPVKIPRIGIPKGVARWTHPDEIYEDQGSKVKVIAGTGQSRFAYCALYNAVVKYDVGNVVVRECGAARP